MVKSKPLKSFSKKYFILPTLLFLAVLFYFIAPFAGFVFTIIACIVFAFIIICALLFVKMLMKLLQSKTSSSYTKALKLSTLILLLIGIIVMVYVIMNICLAFFGTDIGNRPNFPRL
jgi:amino acid permease